MPLVENEFEMYFSKRVKAVMRFLSAPSFVLLSFVLAGASTSVSAQDSGEYESFSSLFAEYREFQNKDIEDYSPAVMDQRYGELKVFQNCLATIDSSNWSVSNQIDYHLVRAEMNGLEFEHRILKRWSRDPGFLQPTHAFSSGTEFTS